jgi:hypothetical protein
MVWMGWWMLRPEQLLRVATELLVADVVAEHPTRTGPDLGWLDVLHDDSFTHSPAW